MQVFKDPRSVFVKPAALEEKVSAVGGSVSSVLRAFQGKEKSQQSLPRAVPLSLDKLARGHPLSLTWRGRGAEHPGGARREGPADWARGPGVCEMEDTVLKRAQGSVCSPLCNSCFQGSAEFGCVCVGGVRGGQGQGEFGGASGVFIKTKTSLRSVVPLSLPVVKSRTARALPT